MGFDVFAILLALVLLMAIAYRGLPVILFAPLCALLAVGLSGRPLLPSLHRDVHGQRRRVRPVVLPAVLARGGLRQADGDERCGRDDRRR